MWGKRIKELEAKVSVLRWENEKLGEKVVVLELLVDAIREELWVQPPYVEKHPTIVQRGKGSRVETAGETSCALKELLKLLGYEIVKMPAQPETVKLVKKEGPPA